MVQNVQCVQKQSGVISALYGTNLCKVCQKQSGLISVLYGTNLCKVCQKQSGVISALVWYKLVQNVSKAIWCDFCPVW